MYDERVTGVSGQIPSQPKPSIEEVLAMRDSIVEGARRKVDPDGTGFDPRMSYAGWGFEGGGLHRFKMAYLELCVLSGSGTIGASIMFHSDAGLRFALPTLAVSALLGAWVVIHALVTEIRDR